LTQRGLVDPYNFHSLMQLTALEREGLKPPQMVKVAGKDWDE